MFSLNDSLWSAAAESLAFAELYGPKCPQNRIPPLCPSDVEPCSHTPCPSHCPTNRHCGGAYLQPCGPYAVEKICGGPYTKPKP